MIFTGLGKLNKVIHVQKKILTPLSWDTTEDTCFIPFSAIIFGGLLRSLVVRALERCSKDPGSSPGGDACLSH